MLDERLMHFLVMVQQSLASIVDLEEAAAAPISPFNVDFALDLPSNLMRVAYGAES